MLQLDQPKTMPLGPPHVAFLEPQKLQVLVGIAAAVLLVIASALAAAIVPRATRVSEDAAKYDELQKRLSETFAGYAGARTFHPRKGAVYMGVGFQGRAGAPVIVRDVNGDGEDDVVATFSGEGHTYVIAFDPSFPIGPYEYHDATERELAAPSDSHASAAADPDSSWTFTIDPEDAGRIVATDAVGVPSWTSTLAVGDTITGLTARHGNLYVATKNALYVLDEATGKRLHRVTQVTVEAPQDVLARAKKR